MTVAAAAAATNGDDILDRVPRRRLDFDRYLRPVRWADVAEYMASNGAAYPFAGATCKRKFFEMHGMN
jgi:hypothetical protein